MIDYTLIVILLVTVITGFILLKWLTLRAEKSSIPENHALSVAELKQRMDASDDLLLLDVRTADDYVGEQGHIEGARLLPLEQLSQSLDDINQYRDKTIVTICRTDRKSSMAARELIVRGFVDVYVVKMGMTDWLRHDYPVAQK